MHISLVGCPFCGAYINCTRLEGNQIIFLRELSCPSCGSTGKKNPSGEGMVWWNPSSCEKIITINPNEDD